MRSTSLGVCFALLASLLAVTGANAIENPLAKLWTGEAVFQESPETIGNPSDNMHFISMFWDCDFVDATRTPHLKAYFIGGPGDFSTNLSRSNDGVNFSEAVTVLPIGKPGEWDDRIAAFSSVWKAAGTYYLVYEGAGKDSKWPGDIGLATSTDGINFEKHGTILTHKPGTFEKTNIGTPSLYKKGKKWYLFYHGYDGIDVQLGIATGTDLSDLTRVSSKPIIPVSDSGWDCGTVGKRSRIIKEGTYYYMAYEGSTNPLNDSNDWNTAEWNSGLARSTDLIHWEKMPFNPVLAGTSGGFGYDGPELVTISDEVFLYFRKCSDNSGQQTFRSDSQTFRAKLILQEAATK